MSERLAAPITPRLAADTIIELYDQPGRPIVLIWRRNPPRGWALPGGFVDVGETVEAAAVREAWEETTLVVTLKQLLGCYSDPERDRRGHTASVVYVAESQGVPKARDDAAKLGIVTLNDLPAELAFDHHRILQDYRAFRETGKLPSPERSFPIHGSSL